MIRQGTAFLLTVQTLVLCGTLGALEPPKSLHIGSTRQLFVDNRVIKELSGARQVLHRPQPQEAAIKAEHAWERHGVSYLVAFRDGDRFRGWYRAHGSPGEDKTAEGPYGAYVESFDGIRWTKPKLGLVRFNGSTENNLVWDGRIIDGARSINLAPFRDDNPAAKPAERYKAIVRTGNSIHGLVSPDGLRWELFRREPLFKDPPFDSHNTVFWDPVDRQYVAYTRGIRREGELGRGMKSEFLRQNGVRWVRRAVSPDFVRWSALEPIDTGAAPREEFYSNAVIRYERAPDYFLMFPSRFASAREPQPGWKHGPGVNDIALLSSSDGLRWERQFLEAFIRPGLDQNNWHERSLYMERGILETSPTELSLFCMQNWRLPSVHIRRYTLRLDGFVSIQGSYAGGEVLTRPVVYSGSVLEINYSTSAVGSVQVELQDESGRPIDGHTLEECVEMLGDRISQDVAWRRSLDLSTWAGKPVRLRFLLKDADLFSFRFR